MSAATASSKPSLAKDCSDCGYEMPITRTNCPHCARPQLFPNVDLAKDTVEKTKLETRYNSAVADIKSRGCEAVADRFQECCGWSGAVFACNLQKLHRQVASGTDVFETYHDLEKLRLHVSSSTDFDWAKLRPQAEIELLGSQEHLDKIHYACLSLDGNGLSRYGDCLVQLAEPMIAHRASCFEGNTAIVFAQEHDFTLYLRAGWADRHRMCVAVFVGLLVPEMDEKLFPGIVIETGAQPEEDRFIEVHVFGAMTAKTFQSVRIDARKHGPKESVLLKAIQEKLAGLPVEIVTSG